jgi:type IV pilus assembly protein PilB
MVLDCRGLDGGVPVIITWLQRDGILSADNVDRVLDAVGVQRITVEEALTRVAGVSDREIARRYSEHFHVPLVGQEALATGTEAELATLLPARFCREHLMVPVAKIYDAMLVATVNPAPFWLHSQVAVLTGLEFDVRVAPLSDVLSLIDRIHGPAV